MDTVRVFGERMGVRLDPETGEPVGDVVHALDEQRPQGPAENAFFLVDRTRGDPRARYISWIGYFDIEEAVRAQSRGWRLIEPAEPFDEEVRWEPFSVWPEILVPNQGTRREE